jgi:hypothetical protein
MKKDLPEPASSSEHAAGEQTGFLFWGWLAVSILNLGMVGLSLAFFAP